MPATEQKIEMNLNHINKGQDIIALTEYEYSSDDIFCKCCVKVTKSGIQITVTKEFDPILAQGEEIVFFREAEGFEAAKNIAENLPILTPEDMEQHGFTITSQVIFDY